MMHIAMYKGPASGWLHKLSHWVICLVTGSKYSHCELVFGGIDPPAGSYCASATARGGIVRFTRIDLGSGRWDVFPLLTLDGFDEAYARQWFNEHAGARYDYFGLLWFLLPIKAINHPKRFFCSEAMAHALRLRSPHKFHPQRLLDVARGLT